MLASKQAQVVVWQPYFRGGGAEAVALWILEALQDDFDVSLHTLANVDLAKLNMMYGTHLSEERIEVISSIPRSLSGLAYSAMAKSEIIRMGLVYLTIHHLKKKSLQYDAAFSAFNAIDMGCVGLQYLHWVRVVETSPEKAPLWYRALMKWVDFSYESLQDNVSISNSCYTADQVKKTYDMDSMVVYPPVVTDIDALPWDKKEKAFLCSGRLVEAKSPHRVINILKAVRQKGFEVDLHITGGGGGVYANKYQRSLRKLIQENSDWVHLHQDLPYADYLKIVAKCRYGIHWKPEPFGISVAEMVKGGMVPFVKSKGGQIEIIGDDHAEFLSFSKDDEAVQKIVKVLSGEKLQESLRQSLEKRKKLFTTQRFTKQIRDIVYEFIENKKVC
ncbi:glycosyltransferase [Leptolyngbya iicbica]|uniref:Glycosyltransferase family 1 protein n=2 Tax=Cyanophyceae TaxID=3028117 RepID=A0A4Q7E3E1_9CYAN|nr:glycosyltransferase [Leptolyngbya sp. LK]RZM76527.1 glycosyltransferase family 1 protein [Leptolyngbya sp. LK]